MGKAKAPGASRRAKLSASFSVALLVLLPASQLQAYDTYDRDVNDVTGFIPSLLIRHGHDDNVNRENDDADPQSSDFTETRFNMLLGGKQRANRYTANYTALARNFKTASELDHVDHHFVSNANLEFNRRNKLDLRLGFHKQTDRLSSLNRSDPEETRGDRYHYTDVGAVYGFGQSDTQAQLELGVDFQNRRYDNNLDSASQNRLKDRDVSTVRGTFYYKLAPATRALIELRQQDYDYKEDGSRLSNTSQAALVGVTWDATANTRGTVKVGYLNKDFDDDALEDGDSFSWEARLDWSPQDRDLVTFTTSRGHKEGSIREDFVDSTNTSIRWRHEWSDILISDIAFRHYEDKYEGSTTDGRKDDGNTFDFNLRYKMRRWVTLGAGYKWVENNSDLDIDEYDVDQYFFDVNFTLR